MVKTPVGTLAKESTFEDDTSWCPHTNFFKVSVFMKTPAGTFIKDTNFAGDPLPAIPRYRKWELLPPPPPSPLSREGEWRGLLHGRIYLRKDVRAGKKAGQGEK